MTLESGSDWVKELTRYWVAEDKYVFRTAEPYLRQLVARGKLLRTEDDPVLNDWSWGNDRPRWIYREGPVVVQIHARARAVPYVRVSVMLDDVLYTIRYVVAIPSITQFREVIDWVEVLTGPVATALIHHRKGGTKWELT